MQAKMKAFLLCSCTLVAYIAPYLNTRYLGPWDACPSCSSVQFWSHKDSNSQLQFVSWASG